MSDTAASQTPVVDTIARVYAVVEGKSSLLYVRPANGKEPHRLTNRKGGWESGGVFSRNGALIAYATADEPYSHSEVWISKADGTGAHRVSAAEEDALTPLFGAGDSSLLYIKAKELLEAGAIGKLNMVTARWDRNSAMGAWSYTVPPDASPETCDWPRFLGTAPKIPFNPEHFFQWRKWKAYGSGVAGDLFVHLFSGTHFITGSHGPTRGMATGGLRFWNDGRDVPDVMLGLFDYREGFNLSLRVNFVDGGEESEGLVFTGSEGTMEIGGGAVTVTRVPREQAPGYMIGSFTEATQKQILAEYGKKYPPHSGSESLGGVEKYEAPHGYLDSYDHFKNFFESVRTRKPVVEDAVFGFRAAGAALLSNLSIERGEVVKWDPDTMKLL